MNRTVIFRTALLLLAGISLAARVFSLDYRAGIDRFDIDGRLRTVLRHAGAELVPQRQFVSPYFRGLVSFRLADCPLPYFAMPVGLRFDADALFRRMIQKQGVPYRGELLYLNQGINARNPLSAYAAWQLTYALSLAGRAEFVPMRTALYVIEPESCPAATKIDWRNIWRRA